LGVWLFGSVGGNGVPVASCSRSMGRGLRMEKITTEARKSKI